MYSPTKGERFTQHFFEWPQEREKLEEHIKNYDRRDVYLSPVLFKERLTKLVDGKPREATITPENFLGSNYLWTEFDGNARDVQKDIIRPTIRVASSVEGHEHWYWRLNEFVTNKVILEDLTKRIAYHYGADLSAYDYQQVLRPINTWNHKRNKPVVLLDRNDSVYSLDTFFKVPIPPAGSKVDIKLGDLPSKEKILAKYRWNEDTVDLMFKTLEDGDRSGALVRLAYEAVEAGCSNEEVYVLIEERDSVWGKFVGRTDREKRLQGIIATVRRKKALNAEITHEAPEVYRFHDFMKTKINLQWAIKGLLPVAGSMVVFGAPGIGKSTFSLRLAIDLALGRDKFLVWDIVTKQKTLFISLEMQHYEVKEFFNDMQLPEELQEQLQEQFYIWPIGNAYPFDTPDQQAELLKFIKLYGIECIIIDSLSLSMYGSVTNDDDIKRLNSFLNEDVRKDLKCSYVFIHHPRKMLNGDANKLEELDDAYGSRYITANAQTVLILSQRRGTTKVHVNVTKNRMSLGSNKFDIERTPDRGFTVVGSNAPEAKTTDVQSRTGTPEQKPADRSLNSMFNL